MTAKEQLEILINGPTTFVGSAFMDWVFEVENFLTDENKHTKDTDNDLRTLKDFKNNNFNNVESLVAQLKQIYKKYYNAITLPSVKLDDKVFVAMWFDDSRSDFWMNGYVPAIESFGCKPVRIDEQQYDGSIITEITKEISSAKAVIADLTNNRGGVYYEAGIARGLQLCNHPLRLIFTCDSSYFKNGNGVHFDVRGYNCIVYDGPDDLQAKLLVRLKG